MKSASSSISPVTLRFYDGSVIEVPAEVLQLLSVYLSFRITACALDALKRLALNSEGS